jgi:methylated-DNA-protein-cysteine methyltransferase-like protein
MESLPGFRSEVEAIVGSIPSGRLMTYGQIAALAGSPRAARIVGGVAHYGNPSLPWQRVVNKKGYLAKGYPGGRVAHQIALEKEGVSIIDFQAPIEDLLWWPN